MDKLFAFSSLSELYKRFSEENFYWRIGFYALVLAALIHFIFVFFFWVIGLPLMAWFNLGSVALYLYCIFGLGVPTIDAQDDKLIGVLVYAELIAHNVLASYFLSREAGFDYYIYFVAVLPFLVFTQGKVMYLIRVVLVILLAVWIETSSLFAEPKIAVSDVLIETLRILNTATFIGALSFISYLFAYYTTTFQDRLITENKIDPLSGLYNRRFVIKHIEEEELFDYGAILLIDIDRFKQINDTYGHHCGDEVIKQAAQALQTCLKENDALVARWGGEEFIAVFSHIDKRKLFFIAEFIRETIESQAALCGGKPLHFTVTIGGAVRESETFEALLLRADEALYLGKESGRNQVHIKE